MNSLRLGVCVLTLSLVTAMGFTQEQKKGKGIAGAMPAVPSAPAATLPAANPQFEKMKTLLGDWEGKAPGGEVVPVTFRLVSAESAILITMSEGGGDMITVVHPNGAELMATHYCSAKNQPRFVAVPSSNPNVIRFDFKDITNLASPDAGHMVGVTFTIVDPDHHTESWIWRAAGKDNPEAFQLTRKK